MRIDILSLFPDMFNGLFTESIIKRAIDNKIVTINIIDFRKYSLDPHHKVDDTPYGGGPGMVLACEPIYRALESIKTEYSKVVLLTPDGMVYNQSITKELTSIKHLILICGHYEGFDDRIRKFVDYEISIGDYVLTGGELPAAVIVDSVVRLLPGAINEDSFNNDSFYNDNLLDYPTYTKPSNFVGLEVPEVLLSGNHQKILEWREKMSKIKTQEKRPDLWEKYNGK